MKSLISLVALVTFSALMLSPTLPEDYPPKKVVEQRKEIVCKERKLNSLITVIECELDTISEHKTNTYGK